MRVPQSKGNPQQVSVTIKVIEVSLSKVHKLGIEFSFVEKGEHKFSDFGNLIKSRYFSGSSFAIEHLPSAAGEKMTFGQATNFLF